MRNVIRKRVLVGKILQRDVALRFLIQSNNWAGPITQQGRPEAIQIQVGDGPGASQESRFADGSVRSLPCQEDNRALGHSKHNLPLGGGKQTGDHRFDFAADPADRMESCWHLSLPATALTTPDLANQRLTEAAFIPGYALEGIAAREDATERICFARRQKTGDFTPKDGRPHLKLLLVDGTIQNHPSSATRVRLSARAAG